MMRRRWGAVHTFVAAPTLVSSALAPEIPGGPIIAAARPTAEIAFEIHLICISSGIPTTSEADLSLETTRPASADLSYLKQIAPGRGRQTNSLLGCHKYSRTHPPAERRGFRRAARPSARTAPFFFP